VFNYLQVYTQYKSPIGYIRYIRIRKHFGDTCRISISKTK